MKILKLPFDTTIKCGCEFEFGFEDIKRENMKGYGFKGVYSYTMTYVTCPLCGRGHELKIEE